MKANLIKRMTVRTFITLLTGGVCLACLTGCDRKVRENKALRERHDEMIQAIFKEDYATCVKLSDPAVVQAKGVEISTGFFKVIGGLVKLAKMTPEDVRIDRIVFSDDFTTAQMETSHRQKGVWKSQAPSKWVRVKGQWYLTM